MDDLITTTEDTHYEAYRQAQMETRKFGEAKVRCAPLLPLALPPPPFFPSLTAPPPPGARFAPGPQARQPKVPGRGGGPAQALYRAGQARGGALPAVGAARASAGFLSLAPSYVDQFADCCRLPVATLLDSSSPSATGSTRCARARSLHRALIRALTHTHSLSLSLPILRTLRRPTAISRSLRRKSTSCLPTSAQARKFAATRRHALPLSATFPPCHPRPRAAARRHANPSHVVRPHAFGHRRALAPAAVRRFILDTPSPSSTHTSP